MSEPVPDPRGEWSFLVGALRGALERRGRFGLRRTASAAPAPTPAPARPLPSAPAEPTAASREVLQPVARPPAHLPGPNPAPTVVASATTTDSPAELAPRAPDLVALRGAVAGCRACGLCQTRTQTVFADGEGSSGIVFVGEAPGEQEDLRGLPFVGPAGQLLTDIIEKGMGLARRDVYICNVLKCRPPGNRDPSQLEKELCTPWLDRQLELLQPQVVIALGRHAAGHLLASESSLGRMRGRVHERAGRRIVVTYHPAYLLRNPADKKECWKDIQLAMRTVGLPLPQRPGGGASR